MALLICITFRKVANEFYQILANQFYENLESQIYCLHQASLSLFYTKRQMEDTDKNDITRDSFIYESPYLRQKFEVICDVSTYTHNGTMAVMMLSKGEPENGQDPEAHRNVDRKAFDDPYGCITVNLDGSDRLPLNVQFVDENNIPGIGMWLQDQGLARPTGMMARSGWCMYPAYEFNLPQEKLDEILKWRMESEPERTRPVLQSMQKDRITDLQDGLDKCMTLGELKEAWLSKPEQIRDQVSFPEQLSVGEEESRTLKEWEKQRFTAPIPEELPAYSYTEARSKFDERKEKLVHDGCSQEVSPTPEGTLTRFGDIEMNQVTHYFPTEYSNPFLVEERDEDGRLTKEYIAIDTSYNDNIKSGPCIEHIDGRLTAFTMYSADITSDLCLRDARCAFSPKGSLIAVMEGDYGPSCGHIRQTDRYNKAVDSCRDGLNKELEKVISRIENKSETQQKSKGPRR